MPLNKYLRLTIDGEQVEVHSIDDLNLAISYKLEDSANFQEKSSSKAFDVTTPATKANDKIANTFHNPSIEDLSAGEAFKSVRKAVIEVNGQELLVGKAFLKRAGHTDRPIDYTWDFYGANGDWLIDLKEATLYDFLKDIVFTFTKANIQSSWAYDGTNQQLPYVFAPVRYGEPMATYETMANNVVTLSIKDYNMQPEAMKPSLSKYWIIYNAFKSLGYRVVSDFFDSEYFRRQVMPWTWGNFLISDGTRLDNLDFLAKSAEQVSLLNQDFTGFLDVKATNGSINGAFNNNNVYSYNAGTQEMRWTYLPGFDYGNLSATFHLQLYVKAVATANSDVEVRVQWFKNGAKVNHGDDNGNGTSLLLLDAPTVGRREFEGILDDFATFPVAAGDVISAKIYAHTFDSGLGIARLHLSVDAFELDYFRIPLGGTIDFKNYLGFKKWKFLDFLKGVVDEFNLAIGTDTASKIVYMEPMHPYSETDDMSQTAGGYFNGNWKDWSWKQDLSKKSDMELFADYERELLFKYKEDNNDGTYKIVKDRNVNTPGMAKYVLPDRFKAGKATVENRFFSAVMHYDAIQWNDIVAGDFPQMICLIPENISNTSRDEAQNTFEPKSAYYKGIVNDFGWMFDGQKQFNFPYMFAVNYKQGGENDPILSYCDEDIEGPIPDTPVKGKGLMRRFYLQRLEIMRNGQYYRTWMKLNSFDVANLLHREHIICQGQKWELIEIDGYKPLREESTAVYLRKWSPVKST